MLPCLVEFIANDFAPSGILAWLRGGISVLVPEASLFTQRIGFIGMSNSMIIPHVLDFSYFEENSGYAITNVGYYSHGYRFKRAL